MLFSDPTGCGIEDAPQVLVQGTADVDDRDLDANRERYRRESAEKLPETVKLAAAEGPPALVRLVLHAHLRARPAGARLRLARTATPPTSRSSSTPTWRRCARATTRSRRRRTRRPRAARWPGTSGWTSSAARYPSAVLSLVAPDGFPFSVRLPIERGPRRRAGSAWAARPSGVPLQPGLACLTAHDHHPGLRLAAQLPGARRPRRGGRRLGADPAQAGRRLRAPARARPSRSYRQNAGRIIRYRKEGEAGAPRARRVPREINETRTSRLRCAPRWPKPPVRRGEPYNLLASLFALRPRLAVQSNQRPRGRSIDPYTRSPLVAKKVC